PFVLMQRVRRSARACFLPQSEVHASDHLALLVEIFERRFHAAVEQHPAVNLDALLPAQVLRLEDRGRRGGKIAALHFVANLVACANLTHSEGRLFEPVIADGIAAKIAVRLCTLSTNARTGFGANAIRGGSDFLFCVLLRHDQPANMLTPRGADTLVRESSPRKQRRVQARNKSS